MAEYSIRVRQIQKLKASVCAKFLFALFLCVGAEIGIFYLYRFFKDRQAIDFSMIESISHGFFYALYFVCASACSAVILFFYAKKLNRFYRRFYSEALFNECKLEEIYLLDHKVTNTRERNGYYAQMFRLRNIRCRQSYSDASSKFSLDITNLSYRTEDGRHRGALCSIHYDQEKPGFLQLTAHEYPSLEVHDGHEVVQYGFSTRAVLKDYHMFSTYGADSYLLERNEYGSKILAIERFFMQKIELIFDDDDLYIFIPDYKITLVDHFFYPVSHARFSEKIEALKTFHALFFDLIRLFDELFITKV